MHEWPAESKLGCQLNYCVSEWGKHLELQQKTHSLKSELLCIFEAIYKTFVEVNTVCVRVRAYTKRERETIKEHISMCLGSVVKQNWSYIHNMYGLLLLWFTEHISLYGILIWKLSGKQNSNFVILPDSSLSVQVECNIIKVVLILLVL